MNARILVTRYASQQAYERALSKRESEEVNAIMKVPPGKAWASLSPGASTTDVPTSADPIAPADAARLVDHIEEEQDITDEAAAGDDCEDVEGQVHTERPGFDGDRVLANEILFLQDHGWWTEAAYAVPEGDVGRLYQILKVS